MGTSGKKKKKALYGGSACQMVHQKHDASTKLVNGSSAGQESMAPAQFDSDVGSGGRTSSNSVAVA